MLKVVFRDFDNVPFVVEIKDSVVKKALPFRRGV